MLYCFDLMGPLEGSRIAKSQHLRLQWHSPFCAPVILSSRPRRRYVVAEAMFYSARDLVNDAYGANSSRDVIFDNLVVCYSYLLDRLGRLLPPRQCYRATYVQVSFIHSNSRQC